jgi:hypothetical protein
MNISIQFNENLLLLQEQYHIRAGTSIAATIVKISKQLPTEDVEFEIASALLPPSYSENPTMFARSLILRVAHVSCNAKLQLDTKCVKLWLTNEPQFVSFLSNLNYRLQRNPHLPIVVHRDSIPTTYWNEPAQLRHKLYRKSCLTTLVSRGKNTLTISLAKVARENQTKTKTERHHAKSKNINFRSSR